MPVAHTHTPATFCAEQFKALDDSTELNAPEVGTTNAGQEWPRTRTYCHPCAGLLLSIQSSQPETADAFGDVSATGMRGTSAHHPDKFIGIAGKGGDMGDA